MGKRKSCDESTRKVIIQLWEKKWSYKKIADHLNCSKKMVFGAIRHYKIHQTVKNIPRKNRPRKTTKKTDERIIRLAKAHPFLTSREIQKEIFVDKNFETVSARTIRRRLNEAKLFGRVARKKPLINKKQRQARLRFARDHMDWSIDQWKRVLWSDETRLNLVGSDGKMYVRRPQNKELDPRYTKGTVKHGGGRIMLWGCFSWRGVGPICEIKDIMDKHKYIGILENHMLPYADDNMPITWLFQHDNDPKHTAKIVKK